VRTSLSRTIEFLALAGFTIRIWDNKEVRTGIKDDIDGSKCDTHQNFTNPKELALVFKDLLESGT